MCSGETETPLKSSPGDCQNHWSYFHNFLLSTAVVRPAVSSAPDVQRESSWWDSKRKKNITTRAANITERVNRCNGAQNWKQVTGNSKQQSKKGKMFETDCSISFFVNGSKVTLWFLKVRCSSTLASFENKTDDTCGREVVCRFGFLLHGCYMTETRMRLFLFLC